MSEETKVLTELPAVAQNVFIACKKCGEDRYHKVIAHSTATSAKVQCEVCGSKKTFKLPKPKKPRKKAVRKDGRAGAGGVPSFAALQELLGDKDIFDYKMGHVFDLNASIRHPKFGVGYVVFVAPQRIDVIFEDGMRSLVHNRGN